MDGRIVTLPGMIPQSDDCAQSMPAATQAARVQRIVFVSDYGDASAPGFLEVGAAANMCDVLLLGGDNNYEDGELSTINTNTAAIASLIADERVFPCLGNHDLDTFPPVAMTTRFPYVANGCRYYRVSLNEFVDLFVLNSGRNSAWQLKEADGNSSSSAQHAWFAAEFAASTKRFKIVMFHHPFVAGTVGVNRVEPEMDWPEFKQEGVILLNGHIHAASHITHDSGLNIINASAAGRESSGADALLGNSDGCDLVWQNDTRRSVCRIDVYPLELQVKFLACDNGECLYQFPIYPASAERPRGAAGPAGFDGKTGPVGLAGRDSFTILSASFAMPAALSTVSVSVASSASFVVNQPVFIAGAGYFSVSAKPSSGSLMLLALAAVGNSLPNTLVRAGAIVVGAGAPGVAGEAPEELASALLSIRKSSGVDGGVSYKVPNGSQGWSGRYNMTFGPFTEEYNESGIVQIVTEEFQLPPAPGVPAAFTLSSGTYHVAVRQSSFATRRFHCRLMRGTRVLRNVGGEMLPFLEEDIRNISGVTSPESRTSCGFSDLDSVGVIQAHTTGGFIVNGGVGKYFWLIFYCQSEIGNSNKNAALGIASEFGDDEIYTLVKIRQLERP